MQLQVHAAVHVHRWRRLTCGLAIWGVSPRCGKAITSALDVRQSIQRLPVNTSTSAKHDHSPRSPCLKRGYSSKVSRDVPLDQPDWNLSPAVLMSPVLWIVISVIVLLILVYPSIFKRWEQYTAGRRRRRQAATSEGRSSPTPSGNLPTYDAEQSPPKYVAPPPTVELQRMPPAHMRPGRRLEDSKQ